MKRKHRHELKQNEFLVWLEETAAWISENRRNLVLGIAAVAVIALAATGITLYLGRRNAHAQALFDEALELFHARISESSVVQAATGPEFASRDERYQESLAAFQKVIEHYPSLDQGRQAYYYAGICQAGLKNYEEAKRLLEEVTGGRRDLLYYLASRIRAAVMSEQGDQAAAIETYRLLIEDPENPLPKDELLFLLAAANEKAGHLEEARNNYQKILEEYPESLFQSEVIRKNEAIEYRLEG